MKIIIIALLSSMILPQVSAQTCTDNNGRWEYLITLLDSRWPADPFCIAVDTKNTAGIVSLNRLFLSGGESYIGTPIGKVERGAINGHGWSYHISPINVNFADNQMELCDASFEYIESNLDSWIATVGSYCPWSAFRLVKRIEYRGQVIFEK